MTAAANRGAILTTGGAGYIGSHAACVLLDAGYDVVILDNFANSDPSVVDRIGGIAGRAPALVRGDVRDREALRALFAEYPIRGVLHFAGLKAVGESVAEPLRYYDTNVGGTLVLLDEMARAGVRTLVFSSSATVYGDPPSNPIAEDCRLAPANPYGESKRMVETVLADLHRADARWRVASLRYFNPVGAHPSGRIGEAPRGEPNNLMPYIAQVASGDREVLQVFGNDYPTPDGTGVRDYIHVMDLVEGHLAALTRLEQAGGHLVLNLGTGQGVSVLEMADAFERASGRPIPRRVAPRRVGDVAQCWADPRRAVERLGWRATRTLPEMCADTWRWMQFQIKIP